MLILPTILIYEAAIFVKKPNILTFNDKKYQHLTCQNINIHYERYELRISSKSPHNILRILYNKLSFQLGQIASVNSFKTRKKHIIVYLHTWVAKIYQT